MQSVGNRARLIAARVLCAVTLGAVLAQGAPAAQAQPIATQMTPAPSASASPEPAISPTPSQEPTPTPAPTIPPAADPGNDPSPEVVTPPKRPDIPDESRVPPTDPSPPPMMMGAAGPETTKAARSIVFTDISSRVGTPQYSKFATEITWLANSGVSNGWVMPNGSREFRPNSSVSRDAMAAFLYRFAGQPAHVDAPRSPFRDVKSSSTFYTEITWAAESGISKGWKVNKEHEFRPHAAITREEMAAFLYRFAGSPQVTLPKKSPFKDVSTSSQFYKPVVWLASTGATTGWRTPAGAEFRPTTSIKRYAMAAFLYRLDRSGVKYAPASETGPLLRHDVLYVYGAATLNLRSGPSTSYPVVTTRALGDALTPTGAVSLDGWIEVHLGATRAWVSGYYLAGLRGAAITGAKSTHSNGKLPVSYLCSLSWDRAELLLCQAAVDLERLNSAFRERYGINIPINDSYRNYDEQVRVRANLGNIAAVPGTSNHGWAAAIDIAGQSLPGGYGGSAYLWLRQQLTGYNWNSPFWARPSGSKPEPWHFEYTG